MDRVAPSSAAAAARFAAKLSEVEEDLAKLRGAREDMLTALTPSPAQQPDIEDATTRTSEDGLATVHTNARGEVVLVELDSSRYNRVDDRDLCGAVLHARTRARSQSPAHRPSTTAPLPKRGA